MSLLTHKKKMQGLQFDLHAVNGFHNSSHDTLNNNPNMPEHLEYSFSFETTALH
jgi:hypothetical protein